jgi:iron-sulfur cluster assembly accessory protein
MITLTPRAARQIGTMQAAAGDPSKKLRIFVESGGCSGLQYGMSFDQSKEGDAEFVSEGVPVLLDQTTLAYLNGSSVDFDESERPKHLRLRQVL